MPSKKQSVHLEDTLHKKIKSKAVNEGSTIEKVVNEILEKELKISPGGDNYETLK